MSRAEQNVAGNAEGRRPGLLARWHRDARGVTAVEFAMVAMPFLMMLFGIIGVGLYFFTTFTLENAVEQASRLLRTGQAQVANYTADQFKAKVCEYVPGHIDCVGKVRVNVKSYADTTNITADSLPRCLNNGGLSNASEFDMGGASEVVLVWVCYEWDLAGKIPFLRLGDMSNGSRLIQATTVFRSEPFN
ncbi:MAG: TadE/TadG family type IV pilus assembly protein [Hyphomicrobiaceae bacterium]|nr:TadE/TadG family type IV pilus assembly protein [Hyphomicrobiaceae bacterium]